MIIYDGEWELCQHDRFRGDCMVFRDGPHANLGPLSARSARCGRCRRSPSPAPGPGHGQVAGWGSGARAVLYEGPGFRGRSIVVNDNVVDNLQSQRFNDRASSLRIERGYWMFCSDAQFHRRMPHVRSRRLSDVAAGPERPRLVGPAHLTTTIRTTASPNWSRGR